jgi:hypothetical protein
MKRELPSDTTPMLLSEQPSPPSPPDTTVHRHCATNVREKGRRSANEACVVRTEAPLAEWRATIEEFMVRARKAMAAGRRDYRRQVAAADARRANFSRSIGELRAAGEGRFTALKSGLATARRELIADLGEEQS